MLSLALPKRAMDMHFAEAEKRSRAGGLRGHTPEKSAAPLAKTYQYT